MPLPTPSLLPENALQVIKGASRTLQLTVTDTCGKPLDITGARVLMTVKERIEDRNPLIYKTSDTSAQIVITVPRHGIAEIYLIPADTIHLAVKDYVFDVWLILSDGKRLPVVLPSVFEVQAGVTVLPA